MAAQKQRLMLHFAATTQRVPKMPRKQNNYAATPRQNRAFGSLLSTALLFSRSLMALFKQFSSVLHPQRIICKQTVRFGLCDAESTVKRRTSVSEATLRTLQMMKTSRDLTGFPAAMIEMVC